MSCGHFYFGLTIIVGIFSLLAGIWIEHSTMKAWPFSRYTWRIRELEAENADLRNELKAALERC